MENISQVVLSALSSPGQILCLFTGSLLGVIFGALPGLTAPLAMAVLLPATYTMEPQTGLGFLLGVHCGVGYGGAIPGILLKIPGTPAAVMTTLDGYPMTEKGLAGKAIGIAVVSSFIGGALSVFYLMFTAPFLSKFALKFGPHEYFAMGVCGLSITSSVIGKSWTKGFWSAGLGILLSTVGFDPLTNEPRLSYGSMRLLSGIPFIPVMIGMFGLTRVFVCLTTKQHDIKVCKQDMAGVLPTWRDLRRIIKGIVQGSIVGTIIGALPGASAAIAAFISYDIQTKISPKIDGNGIAFGEGRLEGIAAPESSNNSVSGGSLIPLLTFGIPGTSAVVVLLGAFMMYDITPGPLFFTEHRDIANSIYLSMLLANIFIFFVCLAGIKLFIKILYIPTNYLMPVILILCVIGAYGMSNDPFHIILMVIFGIVGYFFEKASIPQLPLVLGLILGKMIEENLRQVLILDDNNIFMLFMHPISATLLFFALAVFFTPIIRTTYKTFVTREGNHNGSV